MRWTPLLLTACAVPAPRPEAREVLEVDRGDILCVAVGDQAVVAGSSNDRLRSWGLDGGGLLGEVRTHRRGVTCVGVGPGGRVVTGGPDRHLRVFEANLQQAWQSAAFDRPLAAVAFTAGGGVVGASQAGELLGFEGDGSLRLEREGPIGGGVMSLAFSADGRHLAWAGDGGNLRVWDTQDGSRASALRVDGLGLVAAVALSNAGLLATASLDAVKVSVWDPKRQVLLTECQGVVAEPRALAFAADGIRLAVASRWGGLQVFDVRSGEELGRWSLGERGPRRVAFDPSGRWLFAAGPGSNLSRFAVQPPAGFVVEPTPLEAPVLRTHEPGEDLSPPKGGRLALSRLVFPGYDPPELRQGSGALGLESFPPRVRSLAGHRVTARGYPLAVEGFEGETRFLLSRFPPGCCVGRLPVPDEWIEVTAPAGLVLDPARLVEVTGPLEAGEVLDDLGLVESLYRMQAGSILPVR